MKLSNETIEILTNLASINSNIAFGVEPKVLRSVAVSKNLMAKATIVEDFPEKFGVYDLPQFLNCVSLFENPDLDFDASNKFVTISNGKSSIRYFFSDIENLVTTDKDLNMPETVVNFTITDSQLGEIKSAGGAINGKHLVVSNEGDKVKLTVTDIDDPTSNTFGLSIDNSTITGESKFTFIFSLANFKFKKSATYEFGISSKMIAAVKADNLNYWVALDKNSQYGA